MDVRLMNQYLSILPFPHQSLLNHSKGFDLIFIDTTLSLCTHLSLVFVKIKLCNYHIKYNWHMNVLRINTIDFDKHTTHNRSEITEVDTFPNHC